MTAIKTCDYSAEVPVGSVAFPPACDACRIRTCARNAWHARFRIGEERFGVVGLFNDAAVLQHDHLVGDGSCELHLVRHDEHGLAGIGEFQHHVKHLAHHFRIKRGGDLVEQQHFRMQDQRTADGHALALASGQLMRQASLRSASPTRSSRAMASFSTSALSRFCTSVGASVMLPSTVLLGNRS